MFGLYKLLDTFRRQTLDEDIFHNALIYTFYKQCPKHGIKIRAEECNLQTLHFDAMVAGEVLGRSAEAGTHAALDGIGVLSNNCVEQSSLPFNVEITSVKSKQGCCHVIGSYKVYTK